MTNINNIDFTAIISKFDEILEDGLCCGIRNAKGQMCVEAAVCVAMDLPFSDDPICVTKEIRDFKICLNDAYWSSPIARAKGLRDLGIAQIGSKGVVDGNEFVNLLTEKFNTLLVPQFLINSRNLITLDGLDINCIPQTTNFYYLRYNPLVENQDKYLIMCAQLALEVLKELKSPGCDWI